MRVPPFSIRVDPAVLAEIDRLASIEECDRTTWVRRAIHERIGRVGTAGSTRLRSTPDTCGHPVGRRIGNTCMACDATVTS